LGREKPAVIAPPSVTAAPVAPAARPPDSSVAFDVVRANPQGPTVLAGRAPAGAKVTLYDGERPQATVEADGRGEWAMVVDEPLAPGERTLSLRAELTDGRVREGEQRVVLLIPEPPSEDTGAAEPSPVSPAQTAAVLLPAAGGEPAQLLQRPARGGALALDIVEYDEAGNLQLGGVAAPGSTVRLYLDERLLGETRADPQGAWRFSPAEPAAPGNYSLRADQFAASGRVGARIALPLQRAEPALAALTAGRVVVQPGNSLWCISRQTYGQGLRYTLIYAANRAQIRDPDLIPHSPDDTVL